MKYSQPPQEDRIKILQSLMPEIFDEGKIDWEKLKATLGEEVNFANERYVLNWVSASCVRLLSRFQLKGPVRLSCSHSRISTRGHPAL